MTTVSGEPAVAVVVDLAAVARLSTEHPELAPLSESLAAAASCLVTSLSAGGTVYLAGNGGSMADALHVAGELKKSFERRRPLPGALADRLSAIPGGAGLADHLEVGLRAQVLGADPVLATAVDNDLGRPHLRFAQELLALGRAGDVLVVLSTSGRSPSVINAAIVAQALAVPVVVLTGAEPPAPLSSLAEVVVAVPATATAVVQSQHSLVYHALCRVLEDTFFPAGASAGSGAGSGLRGRPPV